MKYFSTFSGIGGFEIGIQNAIKSNRKAQQANADLRHSSNNTCNPLQERGQSATCIGYSEIDKYADQVYRRNFEGAKNYGDITKINAEGLPDFDCLVGGFPCQAFSIAGKRRGFEDTRGTLFFDLARILRAKQPRLFVFENVKGLLSHDGGRTFKTIIETITELGYDCQWQVLNSKDFGVPQNRERIIIVGHLRGTPRPEVFPITNFNRQTLRQVVGGSQGNRVYSTDGVSSTLASQAGGLGAKTGLYIARVDRSQNKYDLKETETSGTLTSTMYKGIDASGRTGVITRPVLTPDRLEKRQNGRRFKEDGDPAFTVTAQDKHGVYDGAKIRRLTPLECERLQAFPDNWTKYGEDENGVRVNISDTQRYKMCGNAVTTNIIQAVFEKILENKMLSEVKI